jgi:hypothetical protein
MTAEIAILNKSAVALAADSLVTIQSVGRVPKTYVVNKLFTLSKYHPVGVMVYGNAELLGVPWETIIKIFRKHLRDATFATVKEYASSFASFLATNRELFPRDLQSFHFRQTVIGFFAYLRVTIDKQVRVRSKRSGTITRAEVRSTAAEVINEHFSRFENARELAHLGSDLDQRIRTNYASVIGELISAHFEKFELSSETQDKLSACCSFLYTRDVPTSGISGIVVAGFGEAQAFPAVSAIHVLGVLEDQLIYRNDEGASNDLNATSETAIVLPFAQRDVVDSFLQGIDPHFSRLIMRFFNDFLGQWPAVIAENLNEQEEAARKSLVDRLSKVTTEALDDFRRRIDEHITNRHIDPLMAVVEILPKEELASMAEAFINLTSIKRKMSLDVETVGGPIDVAVISKGDGFVWIKRKHYFDPKLNPQFLENYFRV